MEFLGLQGNRLFEIGNS